MDALTQPVKFGLIATVLLTASVLPGSVANDSAPSASHLPPLHSFFVQSAVRRLDHDFYDKDISFLLLDARSGQVLAARWDNSDKPIPLGSLVKPFTALAYAQTHACRYPVFECHGESTGCWRPSPHGKLDIVSAIALSCNAYFRSLAQSIPTEQLLPVIASFDLESPAANSTSTTLIGLGDQWQVSPLRMARAYLELYRRRQQPGVHEIIEGMRQSAQRGTAAAIDNSLKGSKALAKTGTAACTHSRYAPADGFVISLLPADQPEILLMVRVHGVPGAKAAETAGRILSRIEE